MAKAQTPQDHEDDAMKDKIRGKFEKVFSSEEPPTYASIREVEAMKSRIQELEENLRQEETKVALAEREKSQKSIYTVPSKPSAHNAANPSNSRGWFARFWSSLTEPHSSITGTRERNSARLAASFLFIILLLELTGAFARVPRIGLISALSGQMISIIPTLLAYVLSRTSWYRGAIFLFSFFFGSLAYVTMVRNGSGADISTLILVYVPLSLIVASTFLSSWAVLLLVG